jgi:hypothetical protein
VHIADGLLLNARRLAGLLVLWVLFTLQDAPTRALDPAERQSTAAEHGHLALGLPQRLARPLPGQRLGGLALRLLRMVGAGRTDEKIVQDVGELFPAAEGHVGER